MRRAKAGIGPEVCRRCHEAGGCCRTNHFALPAERGLKFDADFDPDAAIPIDRDMPAGLDLLGAHHLPDQATALRHQAREIGGLRLTPDDGERNAFELPDLDGMSS